MVPPQTRSQVHSTYAKTKGWAWWSVQGAGTVAWWITTSALLVALPLTLALEDEARVVQQEREMQMQTAGQQQVSHGHELRADDSLTVLQLLGGSQQGQGVLPPGF